MVEAFATRGLLDVGKARRAIFQHHASFQAFDHLFVNFTAHAHGVLAVHLIGGVHKAVGQFTVSGEHQQASGIDVEATDANPATFFRPRQAIKHGWTAFWVVTGANLAIGLVVNQHAAHRLTTLFALQQAAIEADGV